MNFCVSAFLRVLPVSVLALLLLNCERGAEGQLASVYGTFSGMHSSSVLVSSGGETKGGWSGAVGGGVTLNFLNLHVAKLGVDLRGHGGTGSYKTNGGEISLRAGFQPPVVNLKPFVQVGVGYMAASVPVSGFAGPGYTAKYITFGGHAGLDRAILPAIDWRVVDVGIAHGHSTSGGFSNTQSNPGANFFSVGTGIVARF